MPTSKRPSTRGKKSTGRKAASPSRKREPEPEAILEPSEEAAIAEVAPPEPPPVVTVLPEPGFAARVAPPSPPRPRPEGRRGIFLDVENTSRPDDIEYVLRYLMIDRVGIDTDFTAVGNWRVIGHETARLLAQNGANLVHSAPSVGVRDWSDLRIAVAAGVWLAGTRPGDMIDIVSDDQAFDAVGDVAASLGVQYRRLSYRALTGRQSLTGRQAEAQVTRTAPEPRSRRRGRGRRRGGTQDRPRERPAPAPAAAVSPAPPPVDDGAHTAPHDELIEVVRDLMTTAPRGVTLDQLANALRERGFRRTPGSPRLITRLKRIKELEFGRNGMIRVDDGNGDGRMEPEPAASEPADEALDAGGDESGTPPDPDPAGGPQGARRRRRRRGGRRRRGRRGGSGAGAGSGESGTGDGEVVAAAPPFAAD